MTKLCTTAGLGLVAVTLSASLIGCGSATKTETTPSAAEKSTASVQSTAAEPPSPAPVAGLNKTLQDYLKENHISETAVKHGDPGAPNVALPPLAGWRSADPLPAGAYGEMIYEKPKSAQNPPRIQVTLTKMTGSVDPQQVLALAPNSVRNLPGYNGPSGPNRDKLANHDAVVIGGMYDKDGKKLLVAQKTVLIPTDGGLYVLQIKAVGEEADAAPLLEATSTIDKDTKITP
jgi:Probable lipoprotein LpqN